MATTVQETAKVLKKWEKKQCEIKLRLKRKWINNDNRKLKEKNSAN